MELTPDVPTLFDEATAVVEDSPAADEAVVARVSGTAAALDLGRSPGRTQLLRGRRRGVPPPSALRLCRSVPSIAARP